ncbi:hypothetical protein Dsin_029011 [Dipteronia sinensis]|uniref:Uncharacterized protein n=1 Tax=Dipteronia sinensis TaxID=43782 RepID=A0AAD9ZRN0_9ROSI|nr:hypothetical protein Dsin_029011 [Dipteronia sinensis]
MLTLDCRSKTGRGGDSGNRGVYGVRDSSLEEETTGGTLILNSLDIVSFLVKSECLEDQEKAMKTPVSEVVVPNGSLLRQVDPGTRNGGGSLMFCDTH